MTRIFTIGHGNLREEGLFANLVRHQIETIVDVRSTPYSGRNPQFNKEILEAHARSRGFEYVWEYWLGGKPKDAELWLAPDLPDYRAMARHPECIAALDRLVTRTQSRVVALLCSETDPQSCHRVRMLNAPMLERGLEPLHILSDGSLREEIAAMGRLL